MPEKDPEQKNTHLRHNLLIPFKNWGRQQWADVRGNAKWDAFKTGSAMSLAAIWAVVYFLRQGPAWQIYGLMGLATAAVLVLLLFDSKMGKNLSTIFGVAFLTLFIAAIVSFYQKQNRSSAQTNYYVSNNIDTHDSSNSPILNMVGSPHGNQSVSYGDTVMYKPPQDLLMTELLNNLNDFKKKYGGVNPTASVQIEAASTQRREVAKTLGGVLTKVGLGGFVDITSVGVAPSHSITIWYYGSNKEMANDFLISVAPYLSAADVELSQDDRRFRSPGVILYINGLPNFEKNGHVIVR